MEELEVRLSRGTDQAEENRFLLFVQVALPANLDDREKVLLFNAARKCDVAKILKGEMDFQYQLLER